MSSDNINVFVLGHTGRMGTEICAAIEQAPDLALVPGQADAAVVVDVTTAEAARTNLLDVAGSGCHAVVGTTGLDQSDLDQLHQAFSDNQRSCLVVPNFAISAVLMMRFAEQAAEYFDGVEIIEMHHDQKKDAPSGTAKLTAQRIGGDVPIHSVRLPGLVAHQEVLFGTVGQSLTIRQDSYSRSSFMPGVLLSVRKVGQLAPGVTVGLDAVL